MGNINKIENGDQAGGQVGLVEKEIRNDFGKEVVQTFDIICENPDLTAKEISQLINKTPRTVENYTAKLKDAGIIERKGVKLGGYWKIIDKKE